MTGVQTCALPILEKLQELDLIAAFRQFGLVGERDVDSFAKLQRSAEGRAVSLPGPFSETDEDVALLALGFAKGEVGSLAVPYARRPGA